MEYERTIEEYPEVIERIKNKDYLIKAHSTPCKKNKAISIINFLKILLPPNIELQISFNGKRKAGYAGFFKNGDNEIVKNEKNEIIFLIELPATPMRRDGNFRHKLRVGLVLHEFSHIYNMAYMNEIALQKKLKKNGHDAKFIKTFDMILKLYYASI